jgi:hypothetical protein
MAIVLFSFPLLGLKLERDKSRAMLWHLTKAISDRG